MCEEFAFGDFEVRLVIQRSEGRRKVAGGEYLITGEEERNE